MNIQHVNIVARYEAKLLRRNIVFLGFVILAMIGISLWQVVNQGGDNVFWYKVAFASSLPFFNVYYYNLEQVLIAVFVSMEVVYRERKTSIYIWTAHTTRWSCRSIPTNWRR